MIIIIIIMYIIVVYIIIAIMDIINAYFNVNWYHVVSPK